MSAGSGASRSTTRKRIVLDTDPGIDDALAILYLAGTPDAEIVAVGAAPGNISTTLAAENALRLLDLIEQPHVPVAVGPPAPLRQSPEASSAHGEDGLGGEAGPASARRPVAESAAEQLVRLARSRPGELSVLALGPLTNLALALLLEPELPSLLREVVWMGGAVHAPGNRTPHAEFNAWHDPEAAERVLAGGFALTMVPLDATAAAHADPDWVAAVAESGHPRAQFATRILKHYVDFYERAIGLRGCLMHDPLAAAVMLDPGLVGSCEERQVAVELTGTHTRGMTVTDRRPYRRPGGDPRGPVRVVVAADTATMLDRMRHALFAIEQQP